VFRVVAGLPHHPHNNASLKRRAIVPVICTLDLALLDLLENAIRTLARNICVKFVDARVREQRGEGGAYVRVKLIAGTLTWVIDGRGLATTSGEGVFNVD